MTRIYKLLSDAEWRLAQAAGRFAGSAVDLADGYIHFSAAHQAQETARKYFTGQGELVILAVESAGLGDALRWEPSRGGDLFPHLYAPLPVDAVLEARRVSRGADGVPDLGELAP